ncbi:hypothetical protein LCGC14_2019520 [marine sediment metagenome]|uniref:Uncharacterized protein n=1 Tax=marine sediment metagenome TaxID=412755 RepID=A0A0F9EY71_9ZZZZ
MRTTRIEMVEKEITTWKCDFCDKESEGNSGCCGVRPIMICKICNKDCCREHRHWYSEDDWGDYPYGFYACPNCEPNTTLAWDWAMEYAGRHDDIIEVTMERLKVFS